VHSDAGSTRGFFTSWIRDKYLFDYFETLKSKKKGFFLNPSFYVGSGIRDEKCSDPDPGWKHVQIRIRDPGYNIPDPQLWFNETG
jgi:hypothetical protein